MVAGVLEVPDLAHFDGCGGGDCGGVAMTVGCVPREEWFNLTRVVSVTGLNRDGLGLTLVMMSH